MLSAWHEVVREQRQIESDFKNQVGTRSLTAHMNAWIAINKTEMLSRSAVEYYIIHDPVGSPTAGPPPALVDLKRVTDDLIVKSQIFLSNRRSPVRPKTAEAYMTIYETPTAPPRLTSPTRVNKPMVRTVKPAGSEVDEFFDRFQTKWAKEEARWRL